MADLTPAEKKKLIEQMRINKAKSRDIGLDGIDPGQGLVTDATEGALNKVGKGMVSLLDAAEENATMTLPSQKVAGQDLPEMKFQGAAGGLASVATTSATRSLVPAAIAWTRATRSAQRVNP